MRDDDRKGGGRDRARKSWREIDAARDRGRGQRPGGAPGASAAAQWAQKSYRAALERAFEAGKLAELAKTLATPRVEEKTLPKAPPLATMSAAGPPPDEAASPRTTSSPEPVSAVVSSAAPPAAVPKDPERESRLKLLAKIRESEGRDAITRATDVYLARYPRLPDDFEVLTKVLSHKNDERVREALHQLMALFDRGEKPRRGRTLAAQLRMLEDTHGDPEIRRLSSEARSRF